MNPQELSAQELVQLCLVDNQQAAWNEFFRRYQPTIARVVAKSVRRLTTPTKDLVDDLVQETFLKLLANDMRALRDFDFQHDNALFGFLKTVASNAVMDHFRSEDSEKRGGKYETVSLEDPKIFESSIRSGSKHVDREIIMVEIDACLKSQQAEPNFERDYSIFWLYFQYGLTAKAIAELPDVRLEVKGVESALLRLTKLVRSRMSRAAER